jgi:invasion protein IalB
MNLRVLATAAFVACLMPALPLAVHAASPAAPTKSAQQQTPQKPSDAQPAPTHLGGGQGWDAYSDTEKGQKFCYLVGKPQKSEPASAKRDPIYASIAHRPADKAFNVVSFNAGYLFKENSDAELAVDGKKFSLFTNKDTAWTRDAATDKAVTEALAKGKTAVIKGASARGTETADTYSLAGFGQALALIDKTCNVKR